VSSIAVLIAILVVISLFASLAVFKPLLSVRVDPEIYSTLASFGKAVVYVSSRTPLSLNAIEKWVFGGLHIYKVVVYSTSEIDRLIATSDVVSVYGEKRLEHYAILYYDPSQYNLTVDIDNVFHKALGVWTGRGVTVAVIDTGIDYTHPDFFDQPGNKSAVRVLVSVLYRTETEKFVAWDLEKNPDINALLAFDMALYYRYGEPAFLDVHGHGTHVAGIIAGRGHASGGKYKGIAPGSKLVVVKAFDKTGSSSMDLCLTALEWIHNYTTTYDISILNLSWGAMFASDGSDPLSLAVDSIVRDRGVWVFIAAGNSGNFPNTIHVPAVSRLGFAIGAWDPYYDRLAPFSSLGPTIDGRTKPDFVGAGVMIVSARSKYAWFPKELLVGDYYVALSGTSMAAPAVAGVAACFVEYYLHWFGRKPDPGDFVNYVLASGRRINPLGKDFISGYGIPLAPR
jgi:subtilisin family serine protease